MCNRHRLKSECRKGDDFDLRAQAEADPEAVVARAPALVLDEVQRSRDLLIAVKRAVDKDRSRKPGRFVLTGSANLLMMERIGETLAGRAVYVTLWPFTRRERLGLGRAGAWSELLGARFAKWGEVLAAHAGPREDWRAAARLGGFPVPAHELGDDEVSENRASWGLASCNAFFSARFWIPRGDSFPLGSFRLFAH